MRSGNRGQVIIVFVLSLLVLLGFAALAIDVGYLYSMKGELQRCADAGALAGAYVFHDGGWVSGPVPPSLRTKAESRAWDFATRDPVGDAPLANATISFPSDTDPSPSKVNQITVTVQDNVNLFFAGMFGSPAITLTANATAIAESVGQNVPCLKPFGVPFPYIENSSPPNDTFQRSDDTRLPPNCVAGNLCQGTQIVLRIARPFNSSGNVRTSRVRLESGRLFAMRFCNESSGNYQNRILNNCYNDSSCSRFSLGDPVNLMRRGSPPINTSTINRINDLYNADRFALWNSATKLPVSPSGSGFEGDNWMHSPRVLRLLLYDPYDVAGNPDTRIRIQGYAGFWIEAVNVGAETVTGRFIPADMVGDSSPAPGLIEPSLKTTRLVQ
jgi:hypothetical protein